MCDGNSALLHKCESIVYTKQAHANKSSNTSDNTSIALVEDFPVGPVVHVIESVMNIMLKDKEYSTKYAVQWARNIYEVVDAKLQTCGIPHRYEKSLDIYVSTTLLPRRSILPNHVAFNTLFDYQVCVKYNGNGFCCQCTVYAACGTV